MKTLLAPRLRLREATAADAAFVRALMNDAGYLGQIGDRGLRTAQAAKARVAMSIATPAMTGRVTPYLESVPAED